MRKRLHLVATGMLFCATAISAQTHWIGSWATSVYEPEPPNRLTDADLTDATLRQVIHLSVGGPAMRIHLSNFAGTSALHITGAHVAKSLGAATIDASTDHALTFSGSSDVLIPPGAEILSDPVTLAAAPLSDIAVTIHLDHSPAHQTGHPGSRATIYYAHGDLTAAADLAEAKHTDHWFFLSAVDSAAPSQGFSVVAFGDSITDGHGAGNNANERWPDVLAQRLQAAHGFNNIGVLNQGIGGNHMLTDGLGPNTLARFDRDVLAQTGARTVILLEGINDLGALARQPEADQTPAAHAALIHDLIESFQQFIERGHAAGLRIIGSTITPDVGSDYYHPTPANEADRQALNAWIRTPGHFDGFVDFDKVVADPSDAKRLLPDFDSGDHLHPSPAGYKAMANSIPLNLLTK